MGATYKDKAAAREAVWETLRARRLARFPFPVRGRIPNFKGAEAAARLLLEEEPWRSAGVLKVNPDAPQRPLRAEAIRRGKTLLMPAPRLKAGFRVLDPRNIPEGAMKEAASLSKGMRWTREVSLGTLPRVEAVVVGSVAVTRDGRRCGKGEGYADLEMAVLLELGQSPVPVGTTVHGVQVLDGFPAGAHDVPLALVATPTEVIHVPDPPPMPRGIDWDLLAEEDLEAMPVLRELARRRR